MKTLAFALATALAAASAGATQVPVAAAPPSASTTAPPAPTQVATPATPAPSPRIGYPSPDAALAALRTKPGVTFREENDWIVAVDEPEHSYWSFTTKNIPGHPAVFKRTVLERDGKLFMAMDALCGGTKAECDALVQFFQESTERMKRAASGG